MNKEFNDYINHVKLLKNNKEFKKFKEIFNRYNHIIILGNGGSNSIASHISQDYAKFNNKFSQCLSDTSMVTCLANDFGVEKIFSKFLDFYAKEDSLVIIISSSGNSKNILNAINYCEKNKIAYGTLTGFDINNKSMITGENALWKYHVNSNNYGVVECVHQIFLHGVV